MAMFQNPGAFFLGTLVPSEQKFLKVLLENKYPCSTEPHPASPLSRQILSLSVPKSHHFF